MAVSEKGCGWVAEARRVRGHLHHTGRGPGRQHHGQRTPRAASACAAKAQASASSSSGGACSPGLRPAGVPGLRPAAGSRPTGARPGPWLAFGIAFARPHCSRRRSSSHCAWCSASTSQATRGRPVPIHHYSESGRPRWAGACWRSCTNCACPGGGIGQVHRAAQRPCALARARTRSRGWRGTAPPSSCVTISTEKPACRHNRRISPAWPAG